MKLNRIGALSALVAAAAFGCSSSDKPGQGAGEGSGSIAFKLTTADGLVDLTSVHYDLNTQGTPPVDVIDDDIPVPRPESTISLGIQSLAFGGYSLTFEADGIYHNPTSGMDQPVHCSSAPSLFSIISTSTLTLPTITLTCSAAGAQTDGTGSVNANVTVEVVQTTTSNIVETFSYGPRTVLGYTSGSTCAFPPIALKVRNTDPTIVYGWDDGSDGTFSGTAIDGEYHCGSGGTKVLTITATQSATSTVSTKQVSVVCDDTPCGFSCGNEIREGSEQCDEVSPRCVSCVINPSCGDGVVDGPNGVCSGGVTNAACTEQCDPLLDPTGCTAGCVIIPPVTCGNNLPNPGEDCDPPNGTTCDDSCQRIPTCGDEIVDLGTVPPEACDLGDANSNAPGAACREDCTLARCGDNVTDPGETCDPPNGTSCSATCQTATAPLWGACQTCVANDPDNNDMQQTFCTTPGCLEVEECIINSGCYYPNPYECYCGEGADLDTCLLPSATVPNGPCAALIRTATGNLMIGAQIDNSGTLEASTNPGNSSGDAQLVISELAQLGNACFSTCFVP